MSQAHNNLAPVLPDLMLVPVVEHDPSVPRENAADFAFKSRAAT
jgi:hypothetical protein